MKIDIEELDNLPTKLGRKEYLTEKFGNMWRLQRFDYHTLSDKNDDYWVIMHRIFKEFLGKSVDEAYSKYCKKVKFYEKEWFWKEFREDNWRTPQYIIDVNKNIQLNPHRRQKRKKIIFRSLDFKTGYYDTVARKTITETHYWKDYDAPRYIRQVVSGYEKEFDSRQNREFKRLVAEKQKAIKISRKRDDKERKQKEYSFLTKEEIAVQESRKTDVLKRDRKGFDDQSFKGLEYHGQKRKRK